MLNINVITLLKGSHGIEIRMIRDKKSLHENQSMGFNFLVVNSVILQLYMHSTRKIQLIIIPLETDEIYGSISISDWIGKNTYPGARRGKIEKRNAIER